MSSLNKVQLIGNIGADPDARKVGQSGALVVSLSVATSERWTGQDGQPQERTEWHKVEVWGKQAEACAKYLAKGRKVYVEGQIRTEKWTDKDGVERWTTKVRAHHVLFLSRGEGGGQQQGQQAAPDVRPPAVRSDGPPPQPSDFGDDEIPF